LGGCPRWSSLLTTIIALLPDWLLRLRKRSCRSNRMRDRWWWRYPLVAFITLLADRLLRLYDRNCRLGRLGHCPRWRRFLAAFIALLTDRLDRSCRLPRVGWRLRRRCPLATLIVSRCCRLRLMLFLTCRALSGGNRVGELFFPDLRRTAGWGNRN